MLAYNYPFFGNYMSELTFIQKAKKVCEIVIR